MKPKPTLLEMLDELPPNLCILIARRGRRMIPVAEIRQASGLSRRRWEAALKSNTYRDMTVAEVDAFRTACGITPLNEWRHRAYLIRTYSGKQPLRHLRRPA